VHVTAYEAIKYPPLRIGTLYLTNRDPLPDGVAPINRGGRGVVPGTTELEGADEIPTPLLLNAATVQV